MCNRSLPVLLLLAAVSAACGFLGGLLRLGLAGTGLLIGGAFLILALVGITSARRRHEEWIRLKCPTCAAPYGSNTPFLAGNERECPFTCSACGTAARFLQDADGRLMGPEPVPGSIRPYRGLATSGVDPGAGGA